MTTIQRLSAEALEALNEEKSKLRQLTGAQEKIEFVKAEARVAGDIVVQKYIVNFEESKEYDDFANYWAS